MILDSGTTVLATVPYINRMPSMNIMTCSLDTFEALDGNHHQVFLTGGRKRESTYPKTSYVCFICLKCRHTLRTCL